MADGVSNRRGIVTIGLVVLSLLAAACRTDEPGVLLTISTGTSFGECLGYCAHEVVIGEEVIVSTWSTHTGIDSATTDSAGLASGEWEALQSAVDWPTLEALDDVLGCPDCADGGAEWVRVLAEDRQMKVTFEYGATLASIQPLIDAVREIRGRYPHPGS